MRGNRRPFLRWPSMSAAANELGVSVSTVSSWEAGRNRPPPSALSVLLDNGWKQPPFRPRARRTVDWVAFTVLPSPQGLAAARDRPKGCSEARWRMELRRRELVRRRAGTIPPDPLPDPRDL